MVTIEAWRLVLDPRRLNNVSAADCLCSVRGSPVEVGLFGDFCGGERTDVITRNTYGMNRGAEKNTKSGQMYRSWARWIVATWLDLSPISSIRSAYRQTLQGHHTKYYAAIDDYEKYEHG